MNRSYLKSKNFVFFLVLYFSFLITTLPSCKCKESDTPINQVPKSGKPNVILIVADDFGYELPGYTGGQSYSTPNIDFMATNGMQFTNMFCYPDGFPSRIALFTGKYNFRNYIRWGTIKDEEKMLGNLFNDAGYATGFYGKWQCGNGDEGIRQHGFDEYAVYLPFAEDQRYRRYKNPLVYVNGAYLPDEQVANSYSEDEFVSSLTNFIERKVNDSIPFFAVYSLNLIAQPWVPTPDSKKFKLWDFNKDETQDDISYFPEMVSYADQKIGEIKDKIYKMGMLNNTIFIFTADNNTDTRITSRWRGNDVQGAKTTTQFAGNHIPFFAYWPGSIAAGKTNAQLHDFTDIFKTLADVASASTLSYGTLDGVSFYNSMIGLSDDSVRTAVFADWDNDRKDADAVPMERYAYDSVYKLYDLYGERAGKFYNMRNDPNEEKPLSESALTAAELSKKAALQGIITRLQ